MRFARVFIVLAFFVVAFVSYAAGRASVHTPPPPGVSVDTEELTIDGIESLGDLDESLEDV